MIAYDIFASSAEVTPCHTSKYSVLLIISSYHLRTKEREHRRQRTQISRGYAKGCPHSSCWRWYVGRLQQRTVSYSYGVGVYSVWMYPESVGKSTIVTSLIKESFVPRVGSTFRVWSLDRSHVLQVQHIVPEVTIPPEVTPENVTTYIVDSGGTCYFVFILDLRNLTF